MSTHAGDVLFPPMGIAHVSLDTADLIRHRVSDADALELVTASQPNGPPHLGTVTNLMCAFALGEHLASSFDRPANLVFDALDNGPAEKQTVDGLVWQRSLADTLLDGTTLAERNLVPFREVLDALSARTGVPYRIRLYGEFQALPWCRRTLVAILRRAEVFTPLLSPSEQRLRVRFPCPTCRWVDKAAATVSWQVDTDGAARLSARCFEHGPHSIEITDDGGDFVDANTPVRSVLKAAMLIERERHGRVLTLSVDGSDWAGVWWSRVVGESLGYLGYRADELPSQYFAPLIVDWSGAKFSKSLYVRDGAYAYLPPGLRDYTSFMEVYGEDGFDRLWAEVRGWARDPARFFRSYSVDYLAKVLADG